MVLCALTLNLKRESHDFLLCHECKSESMETYLATRGYQV